jgi:hypothetical protein
VSDNDLLARLQMVGEQLVLAHGEVVLLKAAYERVCEEERLRAVRQLSDRDMLALGRVRHALVARFAAYDRFRLWAAELHALQEDAAARGLLRPTDSPRAAY